MKHALFLLLAACAFTADAGGPAYRCVDGHGQITLQDTACAARPDASIASGRERRQQAHAEARLVSMRLLPLFGTSRAAQYADNRRRCEDRLRVEALCGRISGLFTCDAQGFRPIGRSDSMARAADRNGYQRAFQVEQCAQQASARD
jgi:hypothetical protein